MAAEFERTSPALLRACTAIYGGAPVTVIAVPNRARGRGGDRGQAVGALPASALLLATLVAPFQLACTVVAFLAGWALTDGGSFGWACHCERLEE